MLRKESFMLCLGLQCPEYVSPLHACKKNIISASEGQMANMASIPLRSQDLGEKLMPVLYRIRSLNFKLQP